MKRNGFTLVELIVVVVVIGVLATLAIPQYSKAVERAKGAKAKYAISLIRQAEENYNDSYTAYIGGDLRDIAPKLNPYIELDQVVKDSDWEYSVSLNPPGFGIIARRMAGSYIYKTFGLDSSGNWWTDSCLNKGMASG